MAGHIGAIQFFFHSPFGIWTVSERENTHSLSDCVSCCLGDELSKLLQNVPRRLKGDYLCCL